MSKDALKDLMNQINKKHGEGAAKFGNEVLKNVPIIASTGSMKLDLALGCGGNPRGRIIEYFGPPSGGKTTLALISAIEVQKVGGVVAYIDVENTFTRDWFEKLGGNSDTLIFNQPSSGEEALDVVDMMTKSNEVDFIVLDSTTSLVTAAEQNAEFGDAMMAQLARLMSLGLKKINSSLCNSKATIAFISQTRQKIGTYGNPEDSAGGGNALKFYASVRYKISRGDVIGIKDDPSGFITKITLVKNKIGPPLRKVETELHIGPDKYGIDKVSEVADIAIINSIVNKSGAWIKYNFKGVEERWNGKLHFTDFLRENSELYNEIWNQVSKTVLTKDLPVEGSFADVTNKLAEEQEEKPKKKRAKKELDTATESEEIHIEDNPMGEFIPNPLTNRDGI